jgi:CRISPR-associated protein Cmr3
MSKYSHTIDLIPLDKYHFSSDKKYRNQIKKDNNGKWKRKLVQDYLQRSRTFPQQTSIVGALRYMMLYINGEIPIKDKEVANKIIGKKSWSIDNPDLDLGLIREVSPVMLFDGDTGYDFITNSLHFYSLEPYVCNAHEVEYSSFTKDGGKKQSSWKGYNDKSYYPRFMQQLMESDECMPKYQEKVDANSDITTEALKNLDYGPFVSTSKIGIDKVKNSNDDPDAFYKIHDYKLNNGSFFRVYANLDIEDTQTEIIPIGADGNLFYVVIRKENCPHTFEQLSPDNLAISLISDTYLDENEYEWLMEKTIFSASNIVPFGYIKTSNTKGNKYYTKNPSTGRENDFRLDRGRIQLLEAGSVFYFDNKEDVEEMVNKMRGHTQMRMIGYNMFWNHNFKINK